MTRDDKLKQTLQKRYDDGVESVIEEVQEDKIKVKQGKPWTKDGVYESYAAAATRRDSITKKFPEYATKIKRCGHGKNSFKVIKRLIKEPTKKTKKTKES